MYRLHKLEGKKRNSSPGTKDQHKKLLLWEEKEYLLQERILERKGIVSSLERRVDETTRKKLVRKS
jgi:hypothetical protein